jgi:hypothetical protein
MVKRYGLNTIIFNLMVCTHGKAEVGLIPLQLNKLGGGASTQKGGQWRLVTFTSP